MKRGRKCWGFIGADWTGPDRRGRADKYISNPRVHTILTEATEVSVPGKRLVRLTTRPDWLSPENWMPVFTYTPRPLSCQICGRRGLR